jgi:protein-disulfide isomerase
VIAVALVFAAAAGGLLPVSGMQMRAYLMAHPQIISDMNDRLQAMQDREQEDAEKASAAAIRKLGLAAFFDPKIAFVTGPADAKNTLVEMYDYDCPYCRASLPTMMKFYDAHKGDTRFAFMELPLPIHGPSALLAARASLAARLQPDKYIDLHFALMSSQGKVDEETIYTAARAAGMDVEKLKADMKRPGLEKALADSKALAEKAGVGWTPEFIVNGKAHAGVLDDTSLAELIED